MRKTLLGIAVACLAAGGAIAKDPIGTQVLTVDFLSEPFYIPCVGENVINHIYGETRYHEFQTPSGTVHLLDNWHVKSYLMSQDTDKMWLGYGNSPLQQNATLEKGGVDQYVSHGHFVPVGSHAPTLISQETWKITVNANGELVMEKDQTASEDVWNCVGPEK